MSSALTKRIVLTAESRDRPCELRDARVRGLILRVQPSGHKVWIVTWAHGKRRTLNMWKGVFWTTRRPQFNMVKEAMLLRYFKLLYVFHACLLVSLNSHSG